MTGPDLTREQVDGAVRWYATLLAITAMQTQDADDMRVAFQFTRMVEAEPGTFGVVDLSERDYWNVVQGLRLLAEDPDLFFADTQGPMRPQFRYEPERMLVVLQADEHCPAHHGAEVRQQQRDAARAARDAMRAREREDTDG